MIAEALIWKLGYAEGLRTVDGKITDYPNGWGDQPTSKELKKIVADYEDHKKWMTEMMESDTGITRPMEDIIDALDDHIREAIAPETLEKFNAKKLLRSKKPQ